MPRGRPPDKAMAALKVLWESKSVIGCSIYTYEAGRRVGANVVRRLEKNGFFAVCDRVGRGNTLEIKWTEKGIKHFGGEKPKLISVPISPAFWPKDVPRTREKNEKRKTGTTALPVEKSDWTKEEKRVLKVSVLPRTESNREKIGAIFIDWDNLIIPAEMDKSLPISSLNYNFLRAILEQSLNLVGKAHLFIYTSEGNLIRNPVLEMDAEELEIELVIVPPFKDAADREIRDKAEELLSDENISCFIFASGDGYFLSLAEKLVKSGKKVVMMPYSDDTIHKKYRSLNCGVVFLKSRLSN